MRWQWWRVEVFAGWVSPVQPEPPYVLRYWGVSVEAVFVGIVTAFKEDTFSKRTRRQ